MRTLICSTLGPLLLALAGCGGAPVAEAPATSAPPGAALADLTARGLPAPGTHRAVVLAAPGVDDVSLFAAYYGLVATGWRVRVAAAPGARTAGGRPIPADLAPAAVAPTDYDVLFVPAGLPADPALDALIAAAAAERHLALAAGAGPRAKAAGVDAALADDDAMVRIEGNVLSAARAGDLPHLLWSLDAYAADRLRTSAKGARTGEDPP